MKGSIMARRVLAAIVVALAVGPEVGAQAPPPSPAQSEAARREERRFKYALDLAASVPRVPVVVPAGKELEVVLANAALPAEYRFVVEDSPFPKQTRPLGRGFVPKVRVRHPTVSPSRPSSTRRCWKPTKAAGRPAESLRPAPGPGRLHAHGQGPVGAHGPVPAPVAPGAPTLRPGQVVSYTIERLDSAGSVTRSWPVKFVGGVPDLGWKHPDEETFLLAAVAQEIADMAAVARGTGAPAAPVRVTSPPTSSGARPFRVEARAGGAPVTIVVKPDPHLWAPAAYLPLAKALFAGTTRRPQPAAAPPSSLEALTDLRAGVIEQENRRVSERLAKDPLDPAAHEDAALVLAAFALREAAGPFSDARPAISRLAAHLAVAAALRGPAAATPAGRMAEIALDTLVFRQAPALAALIALQAAHHSAAEAAWIRALSLRNRQ